MQPKQISKRANPLGVTPAIALINPKFKQNVGNVIRAAACFDLQQVFFTGDRIDLDGGKKGKRLPREERMKGYDTVDLINYDPVFDAFPEGTTPVAVEVREHAELLPTFEHPDNPLYVFGPEDGGLTRVQLQHCHRFVIIPTLHCVNLAAAVYMVLYDRLTKRIAKGEEQMPASSSVLAETRGPGWADAGADFTL